MVGSVKNSKESVMVWGAFGGEKLGPLVFCEGKVNSVQYLSILQEHMVDFWYGDGEWEDEVDSDEFLEFQQDNAPVHTAKRVRRWLEEEGIALMDWPAQSPDLNPMENLWAVLKQAVQKQGPKNLEQLRNCILQEWKKIDKNTLESLIDSLPNRIQLVIQAKGGSTRY
jgi:DDE superfamily endonuclease